MAPDSKMSTTFNSVRSELPKNKLIAPSMLLVILNCSSSSRCHVAISSYSCEEELSENLFAIELSQKTTMVLLG